MQKEFNKIFSNIKAGNINQAVKFFNLQPKKTQKQIMSQLFKKQNSFLYFFWIELLKNPQTENTEKIVDLLIKAPDIEKEIAVLLDSQNKLIRRFAVYILGKKLARKDIKFNNPDYLIKALDNKDLGVKIRAIIALSEAGIKKAVPNLAHFLSHRNNPDIQKRAIKALGKIGGQEAQKILLQHKKEVDTQNSGILNKALLDLGCNLRKSVNQKIEKKLKEKINVIEREYFVQVVEGLEKVTFSDIKKNLQNVRLIKILNGKIIFSYQGSLEKLNSLRSIKDIYILLARFKDKELKKDDLFQNKLKNIDIHPLDKLFKKEDKFAFFINLRQLRDAEYRPQVLDMLKQWFLKNTSWLCLAHNYNAEIKLFPTKTGGFLLGLKLVNFLQPQRKWRKFLGPTALEPSLAYLMGYLSGFSKNDIFLDPMCGIGSIVIERALAYDYKKIIASDVNKKSVKATQKNVKQINQAIEINQWNARQIPLEKESISKIVTDLPFGIRSGEHNQNVNLYPGFLKEAGRLLKKQGKAIILSQEKKLVQKILSQDSTLNIEKQITINIGGLRPDIFIIKKKT